MGWLRVVAAGSTLEPTSAPGPGRAGAGRPAPALLLLFAGFYLMTGSGHFYAVDEETLSLVTESLVEHCSFALPPDAWGIVASERPTGGALYAPSPSCCSDASGR